MFKHFFPPLYDAGDAVRPLIGCHSWMGGSAEQTSYIRQDPRACQSVVAATVTWSLVCISWFNLRDNEGTVLSPEKRTSDDTDRINGTVFQVWLQISAEGCYFGSTMGR